MNSKKRDARIAGILYLIFIIFSVMADRYAKFAQGTTALVVEKMQSNIQLFKFGLVSNVLSGVFFFLAAWALFRLLKEVNNDLSLLFLLLNLAGVVIQCVSVVFLFGSIGLMANEAANLFNADKINFLTELFISYYEIGFMIAQVFFGLWLLPLGFLIYRSKFLPKYLGIMLTIDCAAILLWFFQSFLFPHLVFIANACLFISLIAELWLTVWLLVKGIKSAENNSF